MSFTVVVLDGAYPTSVAVTIDMLEAARALHARDVRFEVCSIAGGEVQLSPRIRIATARLRTRAPGDRSTWILPGLGVTRAAAVRARLARPDAVALAKAIARHLARGGRVAASCTAVFLLQQAGVLHGRRATTTWWLGGLLAELAPDCEVDTHAMVCADGPVVTAGAAFAQTDLMLHLLRVRCGTRLTEQVARTMLLDGRQAQARYVMPELLANGDALVGRITAQIATKLPTPPSVAELAAILGMTERTLSRHVRRVTGHSTIALVHSVKAQRAQALLQSTRLSVEDVAAAVGYQDAGTLRRLLKKLGAGPPGSYRAI
jgi:transcriptional regulator GlxA family with amidase domain